MPALLPPQALEDDLQVPPDNTFQKIALKRGQWGASNVVSFTWTALSPNPTRRDPKRPPNEDPVSQVLFILCLLFNFWKRNVTCVLRQWWSLSCRDANCNNDQRKRRNQHFYPQTLLVETQNYPYQLRRASWCIWVFKAWAPELSELWRVTRQTTIWLTAFHSCCTPRCWWNMTWLEWKLK